MLDKLKTVLATNWNLAYWQIPSFQKKNFPTKKHLRSNEALTKYQEAIHIPDNTKLWHTVEG